MTVKKDHPSGRAVPLAMSLADRFAAFSLLTVAAFAVYVQVVRCSYVSKLPTGIRRPVRARLIAGAQLKDH